MEVEVVISNLNKNLIVKWALSIVLTGMIFFPLFLGINGMAKGKLSDHHEETNPKYGWHKVFKIEDNEGGIKWKFETDKKIGESMSPIEKDGTLYFGTVEGNLYAVDSEGNLKWDHQLDNAITNRLTIDPNGTIYVPTGKSYSRRDAKLFAIDENGKEKWSYSDYRAGHFLTPILSENKTIYMCSNLNKLYALNTKGEELWTFDAGLSTPRIGPEGTIYVTTKKWLYAINPNGTEKWSVMVEKADSFVYHLTLPPIGKDGTIYIGSWEKKIYAYNLDGEKKWEVDLGKGFLHDRPSVGQDGNIYATTGGDLYSISSDGKVKWKYSYGDISIGPLGDLPIGPPAIGSDGTIYTGSEDGKVYSINPDGSQNWITNLRKWKFGDKSTSAPEVGENGTIYVITEEGDLYAVDGSKGLFQRYGCFLFKGGLLILGLIGAVIGFRHFKKSKKKEEESVKPDCFGNYREKVYDCQRCEYNDECRTETNKEK